MKKEKPVCETLRPWLKENLGASCLGGLTGQDSRALSAAIHLIELYAYDTFHDTLVSFGDCVRRMQPKERELAYHAIAHVLDWENRSRIWQEAGLDSIVFPRRCAHE